MSAKFTPGPWSYRIQVNESLDFFGDGGNRVIMTNIRISGNQYANANLIAAAPEMYHELEDSVRLMCNNCNQCELDTDGKPMFASQVCEAYTRKVAVLNKAGGGE